MCNLYSQTTNREAIIRLFRLGDNRAAACAPLPGIFPGHDAPVIRKAEDGERELSTLSWGFVLPQKDRVAKRVTNARDEKVRASSFWRGSFEERCCLVPVTSLSEPLGQKPAVWHWFALKGDAPRPPFAFAGLWRSWQGPLKPGGARVKLDTYAVLTTTPNEVVKLIHPSRMPVLLAGEEAFDTWLEGTPDEAFALAKPFPAEDMHIVYKGEKQDAG